MGVDEGGLGVDYGELIKEIVEDRVSGASKLTIKAAYLILKVVEANPSVETLRRIVQVVSRARPSMPSIANMAALIASLAEAEYAGGVDLVKAVERAVRDAVNEYQEDVRTVIERGVATLSNYSSILTHSYSSSVAAILEKIGGMGVRVVVTESRPGLEGVRLAERLSNMGVDVYLVVDAAAAYVLEDVEAVAVGCDALLEDASFLNKVGTRMLALASRDAGKPFYVVSDLWKAAVYGVEVEEHDPREVYSGKSPVKALNPYFEVTPSNLVSGYITEKGLLREGELRKVLKEIWIKFSPGT